MLRHILPNALAPILVPITFGIASAILVESSLSFLGFGPPPPSARWGSVLNDARSNLSMWWLVLFPGLAIFLTVLADNLSEGPETVILTVLPAALYNPGTPASAPPLRLGTRASLLATTQSGHVADALRAATGREVELVPITTAGDVLTGPLAQLGGTGVFVAALREALLRGECDLVVHSMKDLPTADVAGLRQGHGAVRDHPAGPRAHHADAVGEIGGFLEVVRDQQHRQLLGEPEVLHDRPELLPGELVERAEGLVQQQDLGAAHERLGKRQALLPAAGEGGGILVLVAREPDLGEECE
jgi:hypothetical protein